MENKIFKTDKLSFVELRYVSEITSCNKKHQHEELTFTAIKTGKINIIFDEKNDSLKPNEISIVNPNEVHCATLSNVQSLGCYVLYLDNEWCQGIQQSLFNNTDFLHVKISLLQNKGAYNSFIMLCDELLREDVPLIEKEEKLVDFVSNLFLQFCNFYKINDRDTKKSDLAIQIKNYLKDNIEEQVLLEDISRHTDLSVVHILRIFKQEFGLPIHSYLLNKKVHLAKELLAKSIPIAEVAQMSGFFDQSHLNRSFKRVFQLTPKEYQKKIFS